VYELLRPLAFLIDAERAHDLGMAAISRGWVTGRTFEHPVLVQDLMGLKFANPLGLAAGFDKNAHAVKAWHRFGFGFAEIGTITARPQPGNPKPRLFRLPEERAIINRMGFNNDGADVVAERLVGLAKPIPVGINLGKSKVTPLDEATADYLYSFERLRSFADYVVVNVSSPNTPGLRILQEKQPLTELVGEIRKRGPAIPLFIKVAPDLEDSALEDVLTVAVESGATGLIATNTTTRHSGQPGGLSGAPLRERAQEVLRFLATRAPEKLVLIGVGGIASGDDLYERIRAGAHLCQIYTGFVYGGPDTAATILEEFTMRLEREGVRRLSDLRRQR
jgi:dihydroorotate dehydrogenase